MMIVFVTSGEYPTNAAIKRATGVLPYIDKSFVLVDEVNRGKEVFKHIDKSKIKYVRGESVYKEIREKNDAIRSLDPDVVYTCGVGARNWIFKGSYKLIVEHAEDIIALEGLSTYKKIYHKLIDESFNLLSDGYVVASDYLFEKYKHKKNNKIKKLPYGLKKGSNNSYGKHGKSDVVTISYIGTIREKYGVLDLINAADRLGKASPQESLFQIAGIGPDLERAREEVERRGLAERVQLLGFLPEEKVDGFLRSSDVLVAPMRDTVQDRARCPSKIPLYMKSRRPIVTCAIGEVKNYLGDDGFYYEAQDVSSMCAALERAASESVPREIDYDLEPYTWESLAEELTSWLKTL
jgi:glycosyltransferase involved in cell wall biosynthesis